MKHVFIGNHTDALQISKERAISNLVYGDRNAKKSTIEPLWELCVAIQTLTTSQLHLSWPTMKITYKNFVLNSQRIVCRQIQEVQTTIFVVNLKDTFKMKWVDALVQIIETKKRSKVYSYT